MSGPMAIRFFISELTRQVPSENITEDPEWASIIPKGVRDGIDGQRTQSRRDYRSVIPALPRKGGSRQLVPSRARARKAIVSRKCRGYSAM